MRFLLKVVRQSDKDVALVVGAGVTLHEALKAADVLQAEGIHIRVIDIFCLKPIDQAALVANAKACGGKVVTVEDHYPSGNLPFLFFGPDNRMFKLKNHWPVESSITLYPH